MTTGSEIAQERLERLLAFLAVAGGAALVATRERKVVGVAGDVSDELVASALTTGARDDAIVGIDREWVITPVGSAHVLLVAVGPAVRRDVAFVERIRRVRDLLQRFVVPWLPPPAAPPTGSPAHAVVFRPAACRLGDT